MINSTEDEFEKYNDLHCLCPNCYGEEFDELTCIAFVNPKNNPNKHVCKYCGWKGFQRDLVGRNKKNA